jgi:rhodanese-related sulfurtransferase
MVEEISVETLAEGLRSADAHLFLLDVREDDEREAARIEPSVHIPMSQVPARLAEIPKDKRVVVYCHMGGRSSMVASFLESRGFPEVANLTGGIDEWSATVDPNVPRY